MPPFFRRREMSFWIYLILALAAILFVALRFFLVERIPTFKVWTLRPLRKVWHALVFLKVIPTFRVRLDHGKEVHHHRWEQRHRTGHGGGAG